MLEDSIQRIETQQEQQLLFIQTLLSSTNTPSSLNGGIASGILPNEIVSANAGSSSTAGRMSQTIVNNLIDITMQRRVSSSSFLSSIAASEKPKLDFENCFRNFLRIFNDLSSEEKPLKIRHLVKNSNQRDSENFAELLDMFLVEGLQRTDQHNSQFQNPSFQSQTLCQCSTCPYQQELERIDEFYKDFTSIPFENSEDLFFPQN